jgi:hypothetical protein
MWSTCPVFASRSAVFEKENPGTSFIKNILSYSGTRIDLILTVSMSPVAILPVRLLAGNIIFQFCFRNSWAGIDTYEDGLGYKHSRIKLYLVVGLHMYRQVWKPITKS